MFMSKLDLNGDNAVYMDLARNMALGRGYSVVDMQGNTVPANHFPPGYPALLCLLMRCGLYNLIAFKILNGIFMIASAAIVGYIIYNVSQQAYLAFAASVVTVLMPELNYFASIVMSEMSYTFLTMLTLLAAYKYAGSARAGTFRSPWFWAAIVAAVAAYHIRTIGLAVIVTLVLWLFVRREWRQGLAAIGATALLMLPWMVRNRLLGLHGRYVETIMTVNPWRPELGTVESFGALVEKAITNLNETVVKGIPDLLLPFMHIDFTATTTAWYLYPLSFVLLALIFYGAWNTGRLRWFITFFILGNFGLFALWHGGNGYRYVVPIVPIANGCMYLGLFALVKLILNRAGKSVTVNTPYALVVLLMVALMAKPINSQRSFATAAYPLAYQHYFDIAMQVEQQAPRGARICCRKPELFKCFAPSVLTTNYKYTLDEREFIMDLYERGIDYVVFEQLGYESTYRYLLPVLQDVPELFEPILTLKDPDTVLFRFRRELIVFGPEPDANTSVAQ